MAQRSFLPQAAMLQGLALLLVASCAVAEEALVGDINYNCLQTQVANMSQCYDSQPRMIANALIRAQTTRSIFYCSGYMASNSTMNTLNVMAVDSVFTDVMDFESKSTTARSGVAVNFTRFSKSVMLLSVELEVLSALASGRTGQHAWLLNPQSSGSLVKLGALRDLSDLVQGDKALDWADIHPYYRTISANYGGKVVMLPLDGAMWMMYVRHDILAAHGQAVPVTWDQLLEVAAVMNGTDMNGDGEGDMAICLPECTALYMITAIWASIIQTKGMQQGLFYDVQTMQRMSTTAGFGLALEIYKGLYGYSNHELSSIDLDTLHSCRAFEQSFVEGRCAITFGWAIQFKQNSHDGRCVLKSGTCDEEAPPLPKPYVRGRVTTAMLPGSTLVYNRDEQLLEPCTSSSCPYAITVKSMDGSNTLVNIAPYSALGSLSGAVNMRASMQLSFFAYFFLSAFSAPAVSTINILHPDTEVGPFRSSQLDDMAMLLRYGMSWTSVGYEASDVASFLLTYNAALSHPNIAMDLRLPSAVQHSGLLAEAVWVVTMFGVPVETALQRLASRLEANPSNSAEAMKQLQQEYWTSLNYVPPTPSLGPPAAPPAGSGRLGDKALTVAPVACVVVVIMIVSTVGLRMLTRWCLRYHKTLLGNVMPPPAGPETTLLLTDIENSTLMWETCTADVMDSAVRLHHATLRKLLLGHNGYEAATEGDSFIIAFHVAQDAFHFALAAQANLLQADWPAVLDDIPPSRVVRAHLHSSGPPVLEGSVQEDCVAPSCPSARLLCDISLPLTGSVMHAAVRPAEGGSKGPSSDDGSCGRTSEVSSVRAALGTLYRLQQGGDSCGGRGVPLLRGMRVRMGMHTGVPSNADVKFNQCSSRMAYSGEALALARAVSECAHGGQVLLSETSHAAMLQDDFEDVDEAIFQRGQVLVWHMGLHTLREGCPPLHLFMAIPRPLVALASLFPPLRSAAQRMPGVLDAPIGTLAVAVMRFAGAPMLLQWDVEEASHAVSVFQACCACAAEELSGYTTEMSVGEMVGIFTHCLPAAAWCLYVIEALKRYAWSDNLLSHPLCEDLCVLDHKLAMTKLSRQKTVEVGKVLRQQQHEGKPQQVLHKQQPQQPVCSRAIRALNTGFLATFDLHISRDMAANGHDTAAPVASTWQPASSQCSASLLQLSPLPFNCSNVQDGTLSTCASLPLPHPLPSQHIQQTTNAATQSSVGGTATATDCDVMDATPASCSAVDTAPAAGSHPRGPCLPPGSPHRRAAGAPDAWVSTPTPASPRSQGTLLSGAASSCDRATSSAQEPFSSTPGPAGAVELAVRPALAPASILRGPRLKAGLAVGDVRVDVLSSMGRAAYRGKALALARRTAKVAASSQVWCGLEVADQIARERQQSRSPSGCPAHVVVCTPCRSSTGRSFVDKAMQYKCRFRDAADDLPDSLKTLAANQSALAQSSSLSQLTSFDDHFAAPAPMSLPVSASALAAPHKQHYSSSARLAHSLLGLLGGFRQLPQRTRSSPALPPFSLLPSPQGAPIIPTVSTSPRSSDSHASSSAAGQSATSSRGHVCIVTN